MARTKQTVRKANKNKNALGNNKTPAKSSVPSASKNTGAGAAPGPSTSKAGSKSQVLRKTAKKNNPVGE